MSSTNRGAERKESPMNPPPARWLSWMPADPAAGFVVVEAPDPAQAWEHAALAHGFDGDSVAPPETIRLVALASGVDDAAPILADKGVPARNAAAKLTSLAALGCILADEKRELVRGAVRSRLNRLVRDGEGERQAVVMDAAPVIEEPSGAVVVPEPTAAPVPAVDIGTTPPVERVAHARVCPRCGAGSDGDMASIEATFGYRIVSYPTKGGSRSRRVPQSHCRRCRGGKRATT